MPVAALKEYVGEPRDSVKHFHGQQILYASWDHHLLFAANLMMYVPPQMKFREWVEGPLTALLSPDPDFKSIDWSKVEWLKSNQPFQPDFERSLADNGVVHKEQIRLRTPGLNSLLPGA